MRDLMRRFRRDSRGATAVEYGLILALICVAIITAVSGLANRTVTMWNNVAAIVDKS